MNNYIINQNPMFNQMNPINMQNQINQINIQNQMDLMHNQDQMNQILMQNQMNQMKMRQTEMNNNDQLKKDDYKDVYDYIKEDKKKIKFVRVLDNELFKVKVPFYLRKNELYYTAKKYKMFEFSEMQLFHKRKFLSEDETSIDCINDDDEIKIIEEMKGIDFSYYIFLGMRRNQKLMLNSALIFLFLKIIW